MIPGIIRVILPNKIARPLTLQMPITSRCNSKCKTCNVWKAKQQRDTDPITLRKIFKDSFFSEVKSVGINGGEFTLVPDFIQILEAVVTLPKLSSVYLISNGLFPKKLFEYLKAAKEVCDYRNVSLHICISVDGYGKVHETVRGIPNCFNKTLEILNELYHHKETYCHSFSIGCTISRFNISNIKETEQFLQSFKGVDVEYHLAVPNKRINTFQDYQSYYVLTDSKTRLLAATFFYEKYLSESNEARRRQFFANYYFLTRGGRLCTCEYLYRDVTIDEQMNLALCATASDIIGNLKERKVSELIKSRNAAKERKNLKHNYCTTCIHYSYHPLTLQGRLSYIHEELRNRFVFSYYEARNTQCIKDRTKKTLKLSLRLLYNYLILVYKLIWKLQ